MTERQKRDSALSLDKMKEGALLRIVSISRIRGIGQQLAQMGIQVGDTVHVKRCASFGGPILIETRGTSLALSKEWAERITVELVL
jgi:Fe2+ transport system protein FeoA